jgi:dienelactone hydrolase
MALQSRRGFPAVRQRQSSGSVRIGVGLHRHILVIAASWLLARGAPAAVSAIEPSAGYDPLAIAITSRGAPTLELVAVDAERQRHIPVKVYLPDDGTPMAPVILFSHGLGGSREGNVWLGEHWASRGYVVVFLQHPGSDNAVWEDVRPARRMSALRHAANVDNFLLRARDVTVVIDQLERWNTAGSGSLLSGRLELSRLGMSGQSFGAVTTEAVGGEVFEVRRGEVRSPSIPRRGSPAKAFGTVSIPWLLMTGTNDSSPIGDATAQSRRQVFPALPPGDKYELVLDGAEHSAFGDRALPGDSLPRNPNHHRAILAISTAFWDWTLKGDGAARAWLNGWGPATVLSPLDHWQTK